MVEAAANLIVVVGLVVVVETTIVQIDSVGSTVLTTRPPVTGAC